MTKTKEVSYLQYAVRATEGEISDIKSEVEVLYDKFNKERNKLPQKEKYKIRAVNNNDIVLKALKIGLKSLQRRSEWTFGDGS